MFELDRRHFRKREKPTLLYLRYYILKFIHALSFLVRQMKENAENIGYHFSREN